MTPAETRQIGGKVGLHSLIGRRRMRTDASGKTHASSHAHFIRRNSMSDRKQCSKCRRVLSIAEFNQNRSTKDGLQFHCRECQREATTKSRDADRSKYNASQRDWNARHPDQKAAHNKISFLVATGKLPSANLFRCRLCEKQAEGYHHHLGYEPEHHADVTPLCRSCHASVEPVMPDPPAKHEGPPHYFLSVGLCTPQGFTFHGPSGYQEVTREVAEASRPPFIKELKENSDDQ